MAPTREKEQLLSPDTYDDDAASYHSDSDSAESPSSDWPRPSTDVPADEAYRLLDEEEEREELIAGGDNTARKGIGRFFGRDKNPHEPIGSSSEKKRSKRNERKQRRRRKRGADEDSHLMYEMEGGGQRSGEPSPALSENEAADYLRGGEKSKALKSRSKKFCRHSAVMVFFTIIVIWVLVSWNAPDPEPFAKTLSNGTSTFAPTTILISLDGFRADFMYRNLTPTLNSFVANGVSPKYMLPSFPSLTFPNHYTLATGLYPECHGIVGNSFWDPVNEKEFYYTDPDKSMQPDWWGGEPIWVTAETQDVNTFIHMWPGSEAHIGDVDITHIDKYNGSEKLDRKVDRILGYLDLPGPDDEGAIATEPRPQLIMSYVPVVDADGHKFGPNSTEIRKTIADADDMLAQLFDGLKERNLTDVVNVVVVSDHGMATTDVTRLIQIDDLIDRNLIEHLDGWPLYGLRPKKEKDTQKIYKTLKKAAEEHEGFEVYLRDKNMPERFHFSNNERIAPIWMVPETGWAIVPKEDFNIQKALKNGNVYHPRGLHGYDHEHPLMRAIFVAQGPAFPHPPGSRIENFQNLDVYNMVCDSIGIEPAPNNGTLRLPLKPLGLHSDLDSPENETPDDPPTVPHTLDGGNSTHSATRPSIEKPTATDSSDGGNGGHGGSNGNGNGKTNGQGQKNGGTSSGNQSNKSKVKSFWAWVKNKFGEAKTWATHLFNVGQDAGKDQKKAKGNKNNN